MAKFPFGSNQPFYSNREPQTKTSSNLIGVAGILGTGGAILGAGAISTANGGNIFDIYYKSLRTLGHASPYGILSSLRLPEIISPFTSTQFQSGGAGHVVFGHEFLQSNETIDYLAKLTGRTSAQLGSIGIGSGASLRFERHGGIRGLFGQGKLVAFASGMADQVISENLLLAERTHAPGDIFSPRTNVNQFAEGLGAVVDDTIKLSNAFVTKDPITNTVRGAHQFLPFHSITGSLNSWTDIKNRFGYLRGYFAFEAQRPIKAAETMSENLPVVGEALLRPLLSRIGLPKGSTAVKTYLGLAGFGAKIAAAGVAIGEYNWWMRYKAEDNPLKKEMGYTVSSSILGFAAGWLTRGGRGTNASFASHLSSINPKIAAFTALGAFIGQNLLPGFGKGIYAGISQTATSAGIAKSYIGEATGANYFRRKLEETFPGISSTGVGLFVGGAAYVATQAYLPGETRYTRFYNHLQTDLGTTGFGSTIRAFFRNPNALYEAWEKVSYGLPRGYPGGLAAYKSNVAVGMAHKPQMPYQLQNEQFAESMETVAKWATRHGQGAVAPAHVGTRASLPFAERISQTLGHLTQDIHASYKGWSLGAVAAIGAFGMHHLLTTNLVGTIETPEQLKRQATGEEWVPVRKSRWWGGGGTPWEGEKITYRPSFNAMLQADTENVAAWGEDVANISPISRFIKKNFTYDLEERNYYNRPYPISTPAFADVPIVGDILAATIGKIIKPSKLMHVNQWIDVDPQTGEPTYLTVPKTLDSNPSRQLGGIGIGEPISPFSIGFTLSQTQYKLRELQGLSGFVKNTIQEAFTGSETFMPNAPVLAASGQMTSPTDRYWDLNLGGAMGQSELVRRFLPRDRLQSRNRYNPIFNDMPSWIPDELHRGDQYAMLEMGAARLPGAAYEALYPELKGLDKENYPLWHQYQILASVAPYSDQFRQVKSKLYSMRRKGMLTEDVNSMIDRIDIQVTAQRQKRNFYQEGPENADDSALQKTARNAYFGAIDAIKRIAAPVEYLSPFRPFQKFLPVGKAIDDYESNFIYGSETAMWKPSAAIREFIGPSFLAIGRNLGYNAVPPDVENKRTIDEYFDKLTYFKYINLAVQAKESGDYRSAEEYTKYAHKTVYGINPFGQPLSIYSVLPEAEKTHFDAFSQTADPSERARIMQLLPENQKQIFAAMWAKQDGISESYKANQGQSDKYYSEYQSSNMRSSVNYSDFARMKELEQYFATQQLPREDWLGWHSDVDLNDVKLNYIKKEGWDIHDFNLWESQEALMSQKPYLEGLEDDIVINTSGITSQFKQLISRIAPEESYSNHLIKTNRNTFASSSSVLWVDDNREEEIKRKYKESAEQ